MDSCDSAKNKSKVSYDPGWNDPPSLAYNPQQLTPNRPRNFLNKRVAFPLSGGSNKPAAPPLINLPPMPTAIAPPVSSITSELNKQDDTQIDSENTLKDVKEILLEFLESSRELGPKADSIKKKIMVMEEMWLNKKLNKQIEFQMRDLAYALRDDNPNKADEIHKTLMVDHVSAVCNWMPGVKQLIYHCIARSELLAIDKE